VLPNSHLLTEGSLEADVYLVHDAGVLGLDSDGGSPSPLFCTSSQDGRIGWGSAGCLNPCVLPDERIHRFVGTDKFVFLAREALDIFKRRGCCRSTDRRPMLCVALFRSGTRVAQLHPVDPALWACAAAMEDPRGAGRWKRRMMSCEAAGGGAWCRGHLSFQGQDLRAAATIATRRSKSICEKIRTGG
jgi:hypothetical protein